MESRGRTSSRRDRESIANGLRTVGGLSGSVVTTTVVSGRVAIQVVVDTVAITAMVIMMGAATATEGGDECVSRRGPMRGARGRLAVPRRQLVLRRGQRQMSTKRTSKILPLVTALVVALGPGTALARGGHGGGGGGGHGGGFHGGGFSGGHSSAGGSHFGGRYGGHLYLGPTGVWGGGAHWGSGFWLWGGSAWVQHPGRWWVSPAYPGWVWMGEPWVWDGTQWVSQDGYWTTADTPQAPPQQPPVEPPPVEAPTEAPAEE
jgi:hypothetical protein